jgi:UBX domain-containing protein 1
LDDPANAEFLRDLARGQTPRELLTDASSGTGAGGAAGAGAGAGAGAAGGSVVVGLIDKRSEEYVEEFRSFMGEGNSMQPAAATAPAAAGIFDPATLPETPPAAPGASDPTTSIQIRLLSGARQVVRIALTSTVADLAAHVRSEADGSRFQLIAGFPPKPLQDSTATIQEAGLKGAQVTMKKVA